MCASPMVRILPQPNILLMQHKCCSPSGRTIRARGVSPPWTSLRKTLVMYLCAHFWKNQTLKRARLQERCQCSSGLLANEHAVKSASPSSVVPVLSYFNDRAYPMATSMSVVVTTFGFKGTRPVNVHLQVQITDVREVVHFVVGTAPATCL